MNLRPLRVEAAIVDGERHLHDLAQRIGKGHLCLLCRRRLVVGDARNQQGDDVFRTPDTGEAPDFVVDVLAAARRRRAENYELC
jgi:hypothetical protein